MEDSAKAPFEFSDDVPFRRRGRPSGKNRIPLSINERRARNAQYERVRRYETSEAILELAEAAGCDTSLSNSELLATVINKLQQTANGESTKDIEELKRSNEKLIRQVEALEQRLSNVENQQYNDEDEIKNRIKKIKVEYSQETPDSVKSENHLNDSDFDENFPNDVGESESKNALLEFFHY